MTDSLCDWARGPLFAGLALAAVTSVGVAITDHVVLADLEVTLAEVVQRQQDVRERLAVLESRVAVIEREFAYIDKSGEKYLPDTRINK